MQLYLTCDIRIDRIKKGKRAEAEETSKRQFSFVLITAALETRGKVQHRGSRYGRPSAVDSIPRGWLIQDQLRNEPIEKKTTLELLVSLKNQQQSSRHVKN